MMDYEPMTPLFITTPDGFLSTFERREGNAILIYRVPWKLTIRADSKTIFSYHNVLNYHINAKHVQSDRNIREYTKKNTKKGSVI